MDELGGFPVALRLVKEAAKIGADEDVRLVAFPARKSPLQALFGDADESSEDEGTQAMVSTLRVVQPIARRLRALGLLEEPGVLRLPPDAVPALE